MWALHSAVDLRPLGPAQQVTLDRARHFHCPAERQEVSVHHALDAHGIARGYQAVVHGPRSPPRSRTHCGAASRAMLGNDRASSTVSKHRPDRDRRHRTPQQQCAASQQAEGKDTHPAMSA